MGRLRAEAGAVGEEGAAGRWGEWEGMVHLGEGGGEHGSQRKGGRLRGAGVGSAQVGGGRMEEHSRGPFLNFNFPL